MAQPRLVPVQNAFEDISLTEIGARLKYELPATRLLFAANMVYLLQEWTVRSATIIAMSKERRIELPV